MLQLKSITQTYGNFKAVNNISFKLNAGESVAIVGPNGAGKSTLIHILSGTLSPTQGQLLWQGQAATPKILKNHLSVAPQFIDFPQGLKARDILSFLSSPLKISQNVLKDKILRFGVTELLGKSAASLSGGEKKRLLLSVVFSAQTPLVLLDEPSSALDFRYQKVFREILSEQKKDRTFIFTSHNIDEIQSLPDRILQLENGQLVNDQSLKESNQRLSQIRFRAETLPDLPHLIQQNAFGDNWELHTYHPQQVLSELLQKNICIEDLEVHAVNHDL